VMSEELFPFGLTAGDSLVPKKDDDSSGPISIAIKFPYFGGNYSTIFVNTNGGVSFEKALTAYTPEDFPLQGTKPPVLTAYWGDVDTTRGGEIWYREETRAAQLDEVTKAIRSTDDNLISFKADWLFVATWDRVTFYGASKKGREKRNTFQVVLAYDSSSGAAFALMNYDRLEWTSGTSSDGHTDTGLGGTPALAGFDAGDREHFYKIPGSKTPDVLNLVDTSNVGAPGRYIFKINSAEIQPATKNNAGDWTSVMSRTHGDVDFYRDWQQYKDGFGESGGDHWLGLSHLHELCNKDSPCCLRFDLRYTGKPFASDGNWHGPSGKKVDPILERSDGSYFAEYSKFFIENEGENFRLHVSEYAGNAGDSLFTGDGKEFTTLDRDNCYWKCSERLHGAWWYGVANYVTLTSVWGGRAFTGDDTAMHWTSLTGWEQSVTSVEMKVKPL